MVSSICGVQLYVVSNYLWCSVVCGVQLFVVSNICGVQLSVVSSIVLCAQPRPLGPSIVLCLFWFVFCLKMKGKHEMPHELILNGLKWNSVFLEKWQGFDINMHQNRQKQSRPLN